MADLSVVLHELLDRDIMIEMKVTGGSMYPFLRNDRDSVLLRSAACEVLKIGDIVLFTRANGQYVMHRICAVRKDKYDMLGDAQTIIEGPIARADIHAVIAAVIRDDKTISTRSFQWRFLSLVWISIRPLRPYVLFVGHKYAQFRNGIHENWSKRQGNKMDI